MMFSRFTALAVAALPLLAAATPAPLEARQAAPTCQTGAVQCCQQTLDSNSASANLLLGLLNIAVPDLTALIGVQCSPISGVGVGGGNCNAQAVCCQNNNVGGLISIGCLPVTL